MIIGLWAFAPGLGAAELEAEFPSPSASARPWVYFMVMDGNLTREGITADFEAMKRAGIGGVIFIEVNVGIPRGPVNFMSPPWQELFAHAVAEADRLGLEFALATGPGWCGTGGPWVKPELAMQHLVASETNASGPAHFDARLPQPQPRTPYFGQATLTPALAKEWREFYRDEYVLAFPTPHGKTRIADLGEKALYYRDPYSSKAGVKAFLPAPASHGALPENECIASDRIVDLTAKLQADGRLVWEVPAGEWTVLRFGRTITGQTTRPAPEPGLGLESDKFTPAAIEAHFEQFLAPLLNRVKPHIHPDRGLTTLHFDSWEMSAQNWSPGFQQEFQQRRGYSPLPWLPVLTGRVVGTPETSERFLWDLRQTAQELVVQNHLGRLKQLGSQYGLKLSVEPYDLNPCADLELGVPADVPQCEFWSQGYGFSTEFSAFEAVSLSHTLGRPVTAAEAFTAAPGEDWKLFPAAMKNQGDWALCCGINRFIFHRYQHQPWLDRWPGMTFASYGVHWDRTQTWWDMAPAYHLYLSSCQAMLRRGQPVADILYLTPEGAPMVFRPPSSAVTDGLPDRRGFNFDGCAPSVLLRDATVKAGRITFPGGTSYRLLVLPEFETMTPRLLTHIKQLVQAGATVLGVPPLKSPSLEDYPHCDAQVKQLAAELWGDDGQRSPEKQSGKGRVIFAPAAAGQRDAASKLTNQTRSNGIYPDYAFTAQVLARLGVPPDFATDGNIRYIHRVEADADIYFVASRTNVAQTARCSFRVAGRQPELWHPVTGERRDLPNFTEHEGVTTIPLAFAANESYFLVFRQAAKAPAQVVASRNNFPGVKPSLSLAGPWEVSFDPKWGGPERITFARLEDWSRRPEPGIKYYSGKAVYRTQFDSDRSGSGNERYFLSLGELHGMASVTLNGKSLGVVWCPPWRVTVPPGLLKTTSNLVEITVANLWPNRLIGDLNQPPEQRLTWTTRNPFKKESPLLPSGLLGPVTLERVTRDNPFFAMDTAVRDLKELESVRELGYAGISWKMGEPAEMAAAVAQVRQHGLALFAVYCYQSAVLTRSNFSVDPRIERALPALQGTGAVIWLPIQSPVFAASSAEGDSVAVPALQRLADQAAGYHLRVALYPHKGCWVERVQDAVRLAKAVNRQNLGLTFNLAHCLMLGDEAKIPELLSEAAPHLLLVTINGADSGTANASWSQLIRPLDEGSYDVSQVLKRLQELNYTGPVGLQGYNVKVPVKENLRRSLTAWRRLTSSE